MKKLPYSSCFVVVRIDNSIEKIFFEDVFNYKNYSSPDFTEYKRHMAELALADNKYADELIMLLCQSCLNAQVVIKDFKSIAKKSCDKLTDLCVTFLVDIYRDSEDEAIVGFFTLADDEKRDAFNTIAQNVTDKTMGEFVKNLTVEQQDTLFDFA